jgi:hypothetical protein
MNCIDEEVRILEEGVENYPQIGLKSDIKIAKKRK